MIEERCRARDDFMKQERTRNKIMKELTEALEAKDKKLANKNKELQALLKRIAELEAQNQ